MKTQSVDAGTAEVRVKKTYVAPKFESSDICDAILSAKGNNTKGKDV